MARNFQQITERDLARGLDQRSTDNTLKEGFAEVLQNVDTNSNGFLSKRSGYEGFYGSLPVRVKEIIGNATNNTVEFVLDDSVNTAFLKSSPIVVYGKTSITASGDWGTTDSVNYYPSFTTGIPTLWPASATLFELPNSTHKQNTDELLIGALKSTNSSDNSNEYLIPEITVDSSFDIDYNYSITSDIERRAARLVGVEA